ncbi:hypothetical protein SAMN02745181_2306 [Rubritalea squalenifaciens DSM 18772]|uniref:Uncharacterized protein n=1 Tax=Rubritalea squalenifaciens DSM 18772 TaxID=1123071 RepID=A0A1M6L6E2_9BACT|nr:hypothetical protein [Rubritalea squalenifaciens]SHJ66747.1 hypothetical protein SAMN02745181_2306 [Rubritalea squalenifaciens DSM 18772]
MTYVSYFIITLLAFTLSTVMRAEEIADSSLPESMEEPAYSKLTEMDFFMALPKKVLPIGKESRLLAKKNGEITREVENGTVTINWKHFRDHGTFTIMKVIGFTADYRPILEVRHSITNPGMVGTNPSYLYRLTRLAKGWQLERLE